MKAMIYLSEIVSFISSWKVQSSVNGHQSYHTSEIQKKKESVFSFDSWFNQQYRSLIPNAAAADDVDSNGDDDNGYDDNDYDDNDDYEDDDDDDYDVNDDDDDDDDDEDDLLNIMWSIC